MPRSSETDAQRSLRERIASIRNNSNLTPVERQARVREEIRQSHARARSTAASESNNDDDDDDVKKKKNDCDTTPRENAPLPPPIPFGVGRTNVVVEPGSCRARRHTPERLGCVHYSRDCALLSPCCNRWFVCHRCHDAAPPSHCSQNGDPMYVRSVRTVACLRCHTAQALATACCQCGTTFGEYDCLECRLFDHDGAAKNVAHCSQCGVCRVYEGGRDAWTHCERCNTCVHKSRPCDPTRCVPDATRDNCPICAESMENSSRDVVTLSRCGHAMHADCARRCAETSFRCPMCAKTALSEDAARQLWRRHRRAVRALSMPAEFARRRVNILCRDCATRTETVRYHFVGHACSACGGFNTVVEKQFDVP